MVADVLQQSVLRHDPCQRAEAGSADGGHREKDASILERLAQICEPSEQEEHEPYA